MQSRLVIRNDFERNLTLYLEPWGEIYTLLPEDEFEILAEGIDESFYFNVDAGDEVMVWSYGQLENIGVYQKGELLECEPGSPVKQFEQ